MKLYRLAIGVALAWITAIPLEAADNYLIVYKINGKFVDVVSLSPGKLQQLIDQVRVLEGDAIADDIYNAVNNGDLVIGLYPAQVGGGGLHDYDTIGLNPSRGFGTHQARALIHEFEHYGRARVIYIATGYPSGDPAVVGPCGQGVHSGMNAGSAADLCGDGPSGTSWQDKLICSWIDEYRSEAIDQYNAAASAGCSGYPPKAPNDIAPECAWCNEE